MSLNQKFVKIFKKYCKYQGLSYERAKKVYEHSTKEEQEKYRAAFTSFVTTRERVVKDLLTKGEIVIPKKDSWKE